VRLRRRAPAVGHDINCQQAVSSWRYLDGAFRGPSVTGSRHTWHECPHCTEHLKQIETTSSSPGRSAPRTSTPVTREEPDGTCTAWRDDPATG